MRVPEPRRIRLSRDTVLSEHPYLYCEHDPVNWVDPSGNENQDVVSAGEALMGVGAAAGLIGWAIPEPLVSKGFGTGVGIVVGGIGGIVWVIGKLLPSGPDGSYLPPPTYDEWRRYREDIYQGRMRGEIPMPRGGRWRRQPPVMRRAWHWASLWGQWNDRGRQEALTAWE
ncbi:MAG: hypothetical protein GX446_16310 [Chthonomonadales bacterium]|nr:hypothetical protein [Chthonomonadales bacterium]